MKINTNIHIKKKKYKNSSNKMDMVSKNVYKYEHGYPRYITTVGQK